MDTGRRPGRAFGETGGDCRDADLLAILIATGIRGRSAVRLAEELLERYGTLGGIMGRPLRELTEIRGLGPVKAIRLAAAYELSRRVARELEQQA
jgi:DNA repair protein RadC